ncbi:hypothetical protein [Acidisoma silvae]|uniref:Uncharacterized protein n=1 Tax=Acidisoma silvae TaxID=2802396 RepID=A0A963YV59_9PROT|nr:hypothetical protein [Acidisoma silvae]MCB8877609.1 hypothetical protein [Acidisoma silvae]
MTAAKPPRGRKPPARRPDTDTVEHPFAFLPFVRNLDPPGSGRDWWTPISTGNYEHDCILGRHLGQVAIKTMRERGHCYLLAWAVEGMIKRGERNGICNGFLWEFGEAVLRAGDRP